MRAAPAPAAGQGLQPVLVVLPWMLPSRAAEAHRVESVAALVAVAWAAERQAAGLCVCVCCVVGEGKCECAYECIFLSNWYRSACLELYALR